MIRSVGTQRVAAYPVSVDPVEVISRYPIAGFKLGGSVIDYATGEEMNCTFPAANSKYIYRAGKWVGFGANQARHDGRGVVLAGGQNNRCACVKYNPQAGDIAEFVLTNSPFFGIDDQTESLSESEFSTFAGNAYYLHTKVSGAWGQARIPGSIGAVGHAVVAVAVRAPAGVQILTNDGSVLHDVPPRDGWQLVVIDGFVATETYTSVTIRLLYADTEAWFILPHLLRQKRFESIILGDNSAAPATFATEAGSADNGISADEDNFPAIFAMLADKGRIHYEAAPKFDKSDVASAINLLSAGGSVEDLLYLDASGDLAATDGTNVATCSVSFSAGDHLSVDLVFNGDTGKMHIECNGTVGAEVAFLGWDLSLGKVVDIWSWPDGYAIEVGPTRTYYDIPEVA